MKELLQYLETYNPLPQYYQIATGGNWEEAIRIDFGQIIYNQQFTGNVDSSVACEIFYKLSDDRMIFLGLRYFPGLSSVSSPEEFLTRLNKVIPKASKVSLRELMTTLGEQLNDNADTYLQATVEYVELGVEGYWKSVGSKVLRKRSKPPITKSSLNSLLQSYELLLRNDKNNIALEFAIKNPEFWIGVQVSKLTNGEFVTDLDTLVKLANTI